MNFPRLLLCPALAALLSPTAHALIIAGPNGQANSTQASLNTWATANSKPVFPFWNNVIPVSDSSGVYLGNSGSYGWVLTAAHVTPLTLSSSITVTGTAFTVRDNVPISGTDLRLYRIGGEIGDPALPALANIPLANSSPAIGTPILDFGRGGRQEATSNSAINSDIANSPGPDLFSFDWAGAGTMRWGTNTTASTSVFAGSTSPFILIPGLAGTQSFISRFDDPGAGNYLTTTESSLGVNDSGGPVFTVKAGAWEISGINAFVSGPRPGDVAPAQTKFGDYSGYNDLATYRSSLIAAMVPEPSVFTTLATGLFALTFWRKR